MSQVVISPVVAASCWMGFRRAVKVCSVTVYLVQWCMKWLEVSYCAINICLSFVFFVAAYLGYRHESCIYFNVCALDGSVTHSLILRLVVQFTPALPVCMLTHANCHSCTSINPLVQWFPNFICWDPLCITRKMFPCTRACTHTSSNHTRPYFAPLRFISHLKHLVNN